MHCARVGVATISSVVVLQDGGGGGLAHSLLTYAHIVSVMSNRGPTAARHSWYQMHFRMQWARRLRASVRFHFAEGVGSNVHWIKSVVLVNYQDIWFKSNLVSHMSGWSGFHCSGVLHRHFVFTGFYERDGKGRA